MLYPDCSYLLGAPMPASASSLNLDFQKVASGHLELPHHLRTVRAWESTFPASSSLAICSRAPTGTMKAQLLCLNAGQTEV